MLHQPNLTIETVIEQLTRLQEESRQLSNRSTLEPYELTRLMDLNTKIVRILNFMSGEL